MLFQLLQQQLLRWGRILWRITYQQFRRQRWRGRGNPRSRTRWTDPSSRQSIHPPFCSPAEQKKSESETQVNIKNWLRVKIKWSPLSPFCSPAAEKQWKSSKYEHLLKVKVKFSESETRPLSLLCSPAVEGKNESESQVNVKN